MDVRQLRYFVKIAACGSFSRAAAELNVAQPALSQHVANIEQELGVLLLARSTRGVTLTECGETLLGHAEAILRQVDNAARAVKSQAANPSGTVSVGLPSSASLVMAVPLLMEAEKRFPEIAVKVIENHSGYLLEWLKAGRIDMAIAFDAEPAPGVSLQPLLREDLYLVRPGTSPGPLESEIAFEDIRSLPLVLTGRAHGLRKLVERYAEQRGTTFTIKTELDALSAIKDVVASGFGYSILPWPAIRRECADGTLRAQKIISPAITREVQLATSGDWPSMLAAIRIGKLIREIMVDLVSRDHWRGTLAGNA